MGRSNYTDGKQGQECRVRGDFLEKSYRNVFRMKAAEAAVDSGTADDSGEDAKGVRLDDGERILGETG